MGMTLPVLWMCERHWRKHTAFVGVHAGVKIHQKCKRVVIKCLHKQCGVLLRLERYVLSGLWKTTRFQAHSSAYTGTENSANGQNWGYFIESYTENKAARVVISEALDNYAITDKQIAAIIREKIYTGINPPLAATVQSSGKSWAAGRDVV